MAKIVLNPVTNGNTLSTINANFDKIEAEFQDKALYRDNPVGETNTVKNDLDMDGNDIFNADDVYVQELYVDNIKIADILDDEVAAAEAARDAAIASANAAAISAGSAATSATIANSAANNAQTSANDAEQAKEDTEAIRDGWLGVIGGFGYQVPVTYAPGISITNPTQTVEYNGEIYAAVLAEIPFVTSGVFETTKFRIIQGITTSDLSAAEGGSLVGIQQTGIGAIVRTAQDKFRDSVLLTDYSSVQAAVTAASGKSLIAPPGSYTINTDLTGLSSVRQFINQGAVFPNYSIKELFPDNEFERNNNKLSALFPQRLTTSGNYPTVVITGDSLSYNHQDFDVTPRANAEDCYPGMNSWPFLIRDALIRNDPFFKHADEVPYLLPTGGTALGSAGSLQFINPFNGRVNFLRAVSQPSEIKLYYRHFGPQNKAYLWMLKNPSNTGCSFKVLVNGAEQVPVWNTGGTTVSDPYQGLELHYLEIPNVPNNGLWTTITLTNFIGTAAVPHATNRDVYLCGISSTISNIKLTGMGSQSSKWLVDNLSTKLTSFAPDLAIVIIGANDGWAGNPQGLQTVAQYGANLETIYDGLIAAKSSAQMLLLSPPQTNGSVVPVATMARYINKAREVAFKKGFAFIDTNDFFSNTPASVYRFDSIHFSKQGNEMLARKVASLFLPNNDLTEGSLDPTFSVGSYPYATPIPPKERALASWNGTSFTVTRLFGDPLFTPVGVVSKENDYTIKVNLAVSPSLYQNITCDQFDAAASQKMTAAPQNYFEGYVLFQIRKQDGTVLTAGDWTTYSTSLKFIIEVF